MAGSECADQDRGARVNGPSPASAAAGAIVVDGYLVPVDPMDDLQCESCQ